MTPQRSTLTEDYTLSRALSVVYADMQAALKYCRTTAMRLNSDVALLAHPAPGTCDATRSVPNSTSAERRSDAIA